MPSLSLRWTVPGTGFFTPFSAPTRAVDGSVVARIGARLVVVNTADGTVIRSTELGQTGGQGTVVPVPLEDGGVVTDTYPERNVYGLCRVAPQGTVAWSVPLGRLLTRPPRVDGDVIAVGIRRDGKNFDVRLDLETGVETSATLDAGAGLRTPHATWTEGDGESQAVRTGADGTSRVLDACPLDQMGAAEGRVWAVARPHWTDKTTPPSFVAWDEASGEEIVRVALGATSVTVVAGRAYLLAKGADAFPIQSWSLADGTHRWTSDVFREVPSHVSLDACPGVLAVRYTGLTLLLALPDGQPLGRIDGGAAPPLRVDNSLYMVTRQGLCAFEIAGG